MEKKETAEKETWSMNPQKDDERRDKEELQSKGGGKGDDQDKYCFACKGMTWLGNKCSNQKCKKHLGHWTSGTSKTWNTWEKPQQSEYVKEAKAKASEIINKRNSLRDEK